VRIFPTLDLSIEEKIFLYYESIKRGLERRLIYEYRCDERLKTKNEESTLLSDTGLYRTVKFSEIVVCYETIKRELNDKTRHWVGRGTGTPKDKDEVKRPEVCKCEG
jgi:hypothetical protein